MTRLSPPAPNRKTTSRPTLPSLASLRLPDIGARRPALSIPPLRPSNIMNVSNVNSNDSLAPVTFESHQHWPRPRQSSVSSDTSDSSLGSVSSDASETSARIPVAQSTLRLVPPTAFFRRKPSPELCVTAVTPRASVRSPHDVRRYHPNFDPAKHRVVLWHTYEDADAMLVMPYKSLRVDENFPGRKDLGRLLKLLINRSFMVFGPTAWALRDPGVRQKQKAVIHPYRIVPRDPSEPLPPPIPFTLPASMRTASAPPAAPPSPEVEMKDD
ncbi:hypothetical protein PYCCODRAFT_1468577 [Trametes coccinea BRFM310]|uniref:Uncharacterized protein n=1 Tax=Trametes coccinea (strain BRFM310) TaxID=1353009 RepID=A0A1Y2IN54_TRAC3|nr:hypothetical protein PYCCODRAFT_1468577 [Trametes coccinea BRFM310]